MNSGTIDLRSHSSPRHLVIQLARFGDLIQTKHAKEKKIRQKEQLQESNSQ